VLQNTTLPVLVSCVAGNAPGQGIPAALATIIDEHRSIAAVIRGLERVVSSIRERGEAPPFPLLKAMLHYIREFPEALHHPKEDAYLFSRLRQRTPEFDDTLAELERQHQEGHEVVAHLERTLASYEADPAGGLPVFAAAVERFAASQWAHMSLENKVVLPAAQRYLTAEDWAEIGVAFASNGDPRFGVDTDDEFRLLYARILNLMPGTGGGQPPRQ
jgi:hemerythrin-like domain-containing protein